MTDLKSVNVRLSEEAVKGLESLASQARLTTTGIIEAFGLQLNDEANSGVHLIEEHGDLVELAGAIDSGRRARQP